VDGHGRPLAAVVTGGHRNDGAVLAAVLADLRVPRLGPGRPRTRPEAVVADKAYSAGAYRRALHARGIKVVIPEKSDTIVVRRRRGSRGGRPPGLDADAHRGRNVVERHCALTKQWRGLATRYDKLAITYRAAVVLAACITWSRI
jgi:transposase